MKSQGEIILTDNQNNINTDKDILLSIVIPVYNLESYITRCLDSLLDQDVDKNMYEIICIDDGSKDASSKILDEYSAKYPNIKVTHTENGGVVRARSLGLEKTVGRYVWFVDGDDWIKKDCLKYLMDAVSNGENDLLLFKEIRVFEYINEKTDFSAYEPQYFSGGYKVFDSHYTTGSGFFWFSKKILDKYNIKFRPDVYYSDDTLFISKFRARCQRMVITEAPIYYYFQRSDSVSHAVNYSRHCGCMYKLAKEYSVLENQKFDVPDGPLVNKKMKNAKVRSMQACLRSIVMFCKDKSFFKWFLKTAKEEGLYPYGVDWKQLKIDKKQSRKNDFLNWIFAFLSFRPYLWLVWFAFLPVRKRKGLPTFDINDFNDSVL